MRTWIWALQVLPALAAVLCDVRMSERQVMMVNTRTGDEKYTASTLEVTCNDVYQDNGTTVSNPWELYLKACQGGKFYDKFTDGCGFCPSDNGLSPKDVFPELPEDANAWWDRCMPQEHEGSLKCRCSYEYNYFNGEFYDHRRAGGYVDLVDRCAGADPGCMSYQRTMDSWQQSNYVKMPTYTCTGLDAFAPAGDVGSAMVLPPLDKDPLFEFLKVTFADGVAKRSTITQGWNLKNNVFKILFMSRISRSGQDLRVGPSLEEIASSCTLNLNIYFDMEGTAVNNGQPVPGDIVPVYSPLCVAQEIVETKEYMNDITQKIRDIAYSNVTCNSSNQGHHGRRLSKPAFEAEVDELVHSWEQMQQAEGHASNVLQQIQRRQLAEIQVKQRKAKELKRKLQEEVYTVQGSFRLGMSSSCEELGAAAENIPNGDWQKLYYPLIAAGFAVEEADKVLPMFSFQEPDCQTSASGTASVTVKYMGDAGATSGTDDTQTAWFTAIQAVSTDETQYPKIVTEMQSEVQALMGLTVDITIESWDVEIGTFMKDSTGGSDPTGGSGDQGPEDQGTHHEGPEWWELYEGMPCDHKRHLTEERNRLLLQHSFIITGKDTWAGCKGLLDSWVVYAPQKKTKTTNKCAVAYEDISGNVNPAWQNDPCCNWVKRQEMCCAPRIVEENITIVASVNEANIALYSAATDSGTLALDLAMMYMAAETEAAKACFGPYKAFMDATSDVWKVVDSCRTAVEGSWSETFQVQLGSKCNTDLDCYTGECYAPVSSRSGSSSGVKQKYCKTPDEMENPNWGLATLTCLIDKSISEIKGRLSVRLKMPGTATSAELANAFISQAGMLRQECHGHDAWNIRTEEDCMAPKECNYDGSISNETECLNPCEDGDISCGSFCASGAWEVSELPQCIPRGNDGEDPWSACWSFVENMRSQWMAECDACQQDCNNNQFDEAGNWKECNCHGPDAACDFWRREEAARRECMDDYCSRYSTGTEEATLYRWGCIFPGMSFTDSRKAQCLSECSASGGPNPVAPQSCRAILNPATATEDVCWSLGQGWIDVHYKDIPNWDWSYGPPPPESCVIKSYEVLNGKPYVPPPPFGPTCLPECEEELESCIHSEQCYSWLSDDDKPVQEVCRDRFQAFQEAFQACLNQEYASCSGIGCLRIHRACRRSVGLEDDAKFKELNCGQCEGQWSSHAARQLTCAEELGTEQCRWNASSMTTASQACAPPCMWELCDQAFRECQIDGGSLADCNNQTIAMNQCRECNFISCEERCKTGACDVAFDSRDSAYRECAACDATVACNPTSSCYGDNAGSSCNWRWAPEFGYSCPILCEESIRICQEASMGFCHKWYDDLGKSQYDICSEEFDGYRVAFEACVSTTRATVEAANPGMIWQEVEVKTNLDCAASSIPSDWQCLPCDGEWNSWKSWAANLGPKCLDGSTTFDGGRTVPKTCSNCKTRTCPQYPMDCEGRFHEIRQCRWNQYQMQICNKSSAEAKAEVVAAYPECSDCRALRCEHTCEQTTCRQMLMQDQWSRTRPLDECGGCDSSKMCNPASECYIDDTVRYSESDTHDWSTFMTKFQPLMDKYESCTGTTLARRLQVKSEVQMAAMPVALKVPRPQPENRGTLEQEVLSLWKQGNRVRNMARNKRFQMKRLTSNGLRADASAARRNLLEKQHQSLRLRYQDLWSKHEAALGRWRERGGVPEEPPHYPMPALESEAPKHITATRRLQQQPTMVELQCSSGDCSAKSALCDAFINRGGPQQELVNSLVQSYSFAVLPWENEDRICQDLGEICFMSTSAAETAVLQYPYPVGERRPWQSHWCDQDLQLQEGNCVCTSCDTDSAHNYETCNHCCECLANTTGYNARKKSHHQPLRYPCEMLSEIIRKTSEYHVWIDFDEKLLGGAGACRYHIDIWQIAKIPDVCHDPTCYSDPECAKQCGRPEATQDMCPGNFAWSFFKSTREWREGTLSTRSAFEAESCYPQPWIPTKEQCDKVSHCQADCPYCETDQYWDWDTKKTKVKCSFVGSGSQPLSEGDCLIACGGAWTETCKYVQDTAGTGKACLTPPPADGPGSTVYEQCVGQKTLTGASVTSATYELLQCGSFTTEQCGWAEQTFGSDMDCRVKRLQCKNKADCNSAGRCDYQADDWQIQEQKGLCVKPMDFSGDSAYSPERDLWSDCSSAGGEHRSYGCYMNQVSSSAGCTQAGGKWFNWAPNKAKCEVPGYAWKKGSDGSWSNSGTMACCIQLRGSAQEGHCEAFTQDDTLASCEKCGGTWMSIFKFRSHGAWVEGQWKKAYQWLARAFEPSNKWVSRMNFEKVSEVWQSLIAETRAVPASNFISCRLNPTLDTLGSIAQQTAAQTALGNAPLLPGTDAATQLGDVIIAPFENSVEGAEEVDVNVDLVTSAAVVAEYASKNASNASNATGNETGGRRLAQTLAESLTPSCYTVVLYNDMFIGQLKGDCLVFKPQQELSNPVQVCFPMSDSIPVYSAFTADTLVESKNSVYGVHPVTVSRSSDGLSLCASLNKEGIYCPAAVYPSVTPETESAPSGCGSVSAISASVQQEAAALKAAGPVILPGLVKLGEAVADFQPKAVYISAQGTTESKDEFAQNAQPAGTTPAGGTGPTGSGGSTTGSMEPITNGNSGAAARITASIGCVLVLGML